MPEKPHQLDLFDRERVVVNPGAEPVDGRASDFNILPDRQGPRPDSRPCADERTQPDQPVTDRGAGGPCILCKGPTRIMQGGAYRGPTELCKECGTEREIERRRYGKTGAKK